MWRLLLHLLIVNNITNNKINLHHTLHHILPSPHINNSVKNNNKVSISNIIISGPTDFPSRHVDVVLLNFSRESPTAKTQNQTFWKSEHFPVT
jgi:hypothetical protein